MTLSDLLKQGTGTLESACVENASNECRWLLQSVLDLSSAQLLANRNESVSAREEKIFFEKINERANGRPLAYIIGLWNFYGRDFYTGEGVLVPRPETEMLVDFALDYLKDRQNPVVIDLCAGTGCIGLTVACERPDADVLLVEKYNGAIKYLRKNIASLGVKNATVLQADILKTEELILPRADIILSNPPYINSRDIPGLDREVRFEPETALDGGEDGLKFYRALAEIRKKNGCVTMALECAETQGEELKEIFKSGEILKDFNNLPRVFVIKGD